MLTAVRTATAAALLAFVVTFAPDAALAGQGCVTGFNPPALNIPVGGGAISVGVLTSSSTCFWDVYTGEGPWMGSAPFGDTGQKTLTFSDVSPNHDVSPRSATLLIGGKPLPVTQAGNPCPLTVSAWHVTVPASGGTGSFTVNTSGASCSYAVLADPGVTIVSGSSGNTFPATVTFSVPASGLAQLVTRFVQISSVGTFHSAPRVTIFQATPRGCVTGFSPSSVALPLSGNSVSFNVLTSSSTCPWRYEGMILYDGTVSGPGSLPSWLGSPYSSAFVQPHTGPGTISLGLGWGNIDASPRNVTLVFDGQPLGVWQPGNPCVLKVSGRSPESVSANGGTGSFVLSTLGSSCSYVVTPFDGATILSGGSGNTFPATVTFSVAPNTTDGPRCAGAYVSSVGTPIGDMTAGEPLACVYQAGPPVATDAPARGFLFTVHRPSSGPVHTSAPEPLRITNTEEPTASWTATTSEPWLVVSPSSGVGPATATISVNPAAIAVLTRGTYAGTINVTSAVAPNAPRRVAVQLRITEATSTTLAPVGVLDLPIQGATGLSGAVPIGGWAVDDVGLSRILVFRNSVSGEPAGEIYMGDGTRVRGARPDIVKFYESWSVFNPEVSSAGWGLMLLSNVLPNGGNGTFTISAYAEDIEGHRSLLGRKTVTFDNTASPFPFGTIDIPRQGATVSGTLNNQGWILAQPLRSIPFDGSTIRLFIDGAEQPHVAGYGFPRPDVAAWFPFPTYANADGPAVQFTFDTTALTDGLHTIVWVVADDLGTVQGIGSRYMNVQNGSASQAASPVALEARSIAEIRALPRVGAFIWVRLGLDPGAWSLHFSEGDAHEVRAARGERVEAALDTQWWSEACGPYAGYVVTGEVAGPLPPGASLDGEAGVFRWQPPIEFAGTYDFVFVRRACSGREQRIPLRLTIGRG